MKKIIKITALIAGLLLLTVGVYAVDPNPSIDIEKTTKGEDADYAPGPIIVIGDSVEWTYTVTNTGDEELSGITIDDDIEGDVSCAPFALKAEEKLVCTAFGIASPGQYVNKVTVTATSTSGSVVSDMDSSHYYGRSEDGAGGKASVNIKIGSNSGKPATINLKSRGKVPVAVFSEAAFDASTIIPESVRFAGAAASHWNLANGGSSNERVIFHFPTQSLNLNQTSTTATLTGQTTGGIYFAGTDSVRIVPEKPNKPPKNPKKPPKNPKKPKPKKPNKPPKGPKK